MDVWSSVDFCGEETNEVVLTEEEFYDLLSLISWAPDGLHSSTMAEMGRVNREINGDEEDEDG